MRTLRGQNLVRNTDTARFPDGTIQNKTDTEQGTPVIEEVYGDLITNIYRLLRRNGVTPTETQDGSTTQYQLVEALAKNFNELNDIMQVLNVSGTTITTAFNFDNMPTNYVFIGRVTDAITVQNYTLNSAGSNSFTLVARQPIGASELAMVVLNGNNSFIIALENVIDDSELNTSFGTPLTFNESTQLYYLSNGRVFTSTPTIFLTENLIRTSEGNNNIFLLDCIVHKGKLLAYCVDTTTGVEATHVYRLFAFDLNSLNTVESEVTIPNTSAANNQPYMYCDGTNIFFTNSNAQINNASADNSVASFVFNETAFTLTHVSTFTLNSSFVKTTNVFFNAAGQLHTFINGVLNRYVLSGGTGITIATYNTINGFVFRFNGNTYYTNGNTAIKWTV